MADNPTARGAVVDLAQFRSGVDPTRLCTGLGEAITRLRVDPFGVGRLRLDELRFPDLLPQQVELWLVAPVVCVALVAPLDLDLAPLRRPCESPHRRWARPADRVSGASHPQPWRPTAPRRRP